jgi:hypothetical protein
MPKDSIRDPGSETGRALFEEFVRAANGRSIEDVLSACANMIANCLRQNYGLKSEVETRLQELYARSAEVLLQHYDSTTGRRRSVVPFDQTVRPQLILNSDLFTNLGDGRRDN